MTQTLPLKALSIILWTWFLVSSIIFTPVITVLWLLTFWFDRNLRIVHKFSCFWGAQYIWMTPLWRLKIIDRKKFNDHKACIVISNHQSLVDIIVIYSLFKHFRWTSKVENFKLPFVGWVLAFNRSIKVYRTSPEAYRLFKNQAVKAHAKGNSIMIFPEGTRSKDGNMGRFRDGAFRLAHDLKADILPMVLDGSARAIPKTGWSLTGKQRIVLKVLDPVSYEEFENLNIKETRTKFQNLISDELKTLRENTNNQ
ncbi:MAG: lysophospholipid acyltransferase family protein [Bacteroidales bacterium]